MTDIISARLAELGIALPSPAAPVASYVPAVEVGGMLYISGQLPFRADGSLITGRLGEDYDVAHGQEAAERCAIMLLAQMEKALGSLDRVARVVKLGAFVACDPHFTQQPQVANGASQLMERVFGEAGRHARSAVGVPVLPLGAAVEVDAIVAVKEADLRALIARPFAHRGLHGGGLIENSRAAFEAAIEARHGIELDVQASGDKQAMVFHDEELGRLTMVEGFLRGRAAADLTRIRLRDSAETIPTLTEILALIAGRAPLLIEVKAPGREVGALCRAVADALGGYAGPVAVMSFNPEIGHWFARYEAKWLRGLVVTEKGRKWRGWLTRRLALWRSKADFLAYDIRDLPSRFAEAQQRKGLRVLTWTVRSLTDRARAAQHADQIIYEAETR